MPTRNGQIFIETVGSVTYGISLDDIGRCLGLSSRDLGTLCQGGKDYDETKNFYDGQINIWSKNKPTYFASLESGNSQRIANKQSERENPYIENEYLFMTHSIEIPSAKKLYDSNSSQVSELIKAGSGFIGGVAQDGESISQTNVKTLRWKFQPPMGMAQGAASTFFRARDFENYNRNCVSPLPYVLDNVLVMTAPQGTHQGQIYVDAVLPNGLPSGNLTFEELLYQHENGATTNGKPLTGLLLCALLYHYNGTTIDIMYWMCSSVKYSDTPNTNWNRIVYYIPNVDKRNEILGNTDGWRVKTFFCDEQFAQNTRHLNGTTVKDVLCIRGSEETANVSIVPIDSEQNIVHVRLEHAYIAEVDEGNNTYGYSIQAVLFNYINGDTLLDEVSIEYYNSNTKKYIGYMKFITTQTERTESVTLSSMSAVSIHSLGVVHLDDSIPLDFVVYAHKEDDESFGVVVKNVTFGTKSDSAIYFNKLQEFRDMGYHD